MNTIDNWIINMENEIPVEIFGVGKPFISDGDLMNEYYKQLVK